jgi:hypothetical protein
MSETDPTGAAPARLPVAGESDVTYPHLTEAQSLRSLHTRTQAVTLA